MLDELLRNSCGRYYGRDMAESGHDANERRSTLLTHSVILRGRSGATQHGGSAHCRVASARSEGPARLGVHRPDVVARAKTAEFAAQRERRSGASGGERCAGAQTLRPAVLDSGKRNGDRQSVRGREVVVKPNVGRDEPSRRRPPRIADLVGAVLSERGKKRKTQLDFEFI
jgi:hypothetical protein